MSDGAALNGCTLARSPYGNGKQALRNCRAATQPQLPSIYTKLLLRLLAAYTPNICQWATRRMVVVKFEKFTDKFSKVAMFVAASVLMIQASAKIVGKSKQMILNRKLNKEGKKIYTAAA